MTFDEISHDDPQQPHGANGSAAAPLRSGARATALTTAVSLVLVGGVVTAAIRGGSGNTAADTLAPASTFAFAQVDLSLADDSSSDLSAFLGHFPDSPTRKGKGSIRDRVLRAMLRDSSDPHVDYDKDVKPWLGNHAAVAGWLDDSGKPQVEFLLQSTNDGAARSSLHRADPHLGVAFSHGYAVIGQTQALADAAVHAAGKSSLASSSHFQADLGRLSGRQLVSGWVDAAGAIQAIRKAGGTANPFDRLPPSMFGGTKALDQVKGRVVFGVHATKTYVEVAAQTIDGSGPSAGGVPADMLTNLPDGTIAAAEVANPGKIVSAGWTVLSGVLGAAAFSASSASIGASSAFEGSSTITVNGKTMIVPGGAVIAKPRPTLTIQQQVEKATGLRLPGDAETLLGSAMVISYGGLQGQGVPRIALVTRPADLAAARALAEHARDVIAHNAPLQLAVGSRGGTDLVVASDEVYRAAVEAGGHLGSQPGFTEAMGTLPDRLGFAAYVNLADIVPLFSHGQRDLDRLAGLGIWTGQVGSGQRMQLRLVVH